PGLVRPPGVPLLACWNDENTEDWLFLSGGASGEKPLLVVGWSRGGRSTLGRITTARSSATTRYTSGRYRSVRDERRTTLAVAVIAPTTSSSLMRIQDALH